MQPEQIEQFARVLEIWRQNHKGTFLYDFTLLIEVVLESVANMPAEMQSERIEWQRFHEDFLCLLESNVR